jgi:predicted RNA binding protein YcfA (HicA-like mRNA interferase family)
MVGRLPRVTASAALRALLRGGWYIDHQTGGHATLMHPDKPRRRVQVPRHAGVILKPKTLRSILNQAGLTLEEFGRLL